MTPRVGDVVHVRGTVVDLGSQTGLVKFSPINSRDEALWVDPVRIVHIEPAPLKVGDRVACDGVHATVWAEQGDWLWVDIKGREWPDTWRKTDVERLP